MKKIITAISNPILNNSLININEFSVICKDIQYKEGILEILEENKNIDIIIMSDDLPGEIEFEELIEKILKINSNIKFFIIYNNKDVKKLDFLKSKQITNVFKKDQIKIEELINLILDDKKEKNNNFYNWENTEKNNYNNLLIENKNNIFYLNKKIKIYTNNFLKIKKIKLIIKKIIKKIKIELIIKIKNKIKKYLILKLKKINIKIKNKKQKLKSDDKQKIKEARIIAFCGIHGSGKSVSIIAFSQCLKKLNKKILIIDFDFFNKSISTILGTKKLKKENLIENKINKNLYFLSGENLIENNFEKIKNFKNEFDYIFIDNNFFKNNKNTKFIFEISDEIFFFIEPNLIEIEKSKKLLDEIQLNFNLKNIKIILNKVTKNSTNKKIIKNIFYNQEIIGEIQFNDRYNLIINKNNNYYLNNYYEYEKIIEKINNKNGGK